MSSFGDQLRKARGGEYIEPPAGKYDVRVKKADAFTSNKGEDFAKLELEIVDGEHEGGVMQHFMGFSHPVGREINVEALVSYGVALDAIEEVEDLDDALQKIIGTKAEVGVSYRNDYISIKVHRSTPPDPQSELTPADGGGGFSERQTVPADSDLPF